jgi:hypothetical protein
MFPRPIGRRMVGTAPRPKIGGVRVEAERGKSGGHGRSDGRKILARTLHETVIRPRPFAQGSGVPDFQVLTYVANLESEIDRLRKQRQFGRYAGLHDVDGFLT